MENETHGRLYEIQEIPGKGRGMIAATTITKGTRILAEPPLFRVPRRGGNREHLRDAISRKVASLNNEQRQAFLSLHNSFEAEDGPNLGRVRTNALPLGSDATTGGIFLESSRINHSCNHNAQNTWNESLQKLTIHAIRDIPKGDEVTIMYLHDRGNRGARLQFLQTQFRFTCTCSLCSLPVGQRKMSDERCDEILRLDSLIGDATRLMIAPLQALHDVHRMLSLLAQEGFEDASIPRAYYDAFQIAITHGDIARAKVFAERAASTRKVLEGEDSPTVRRMAGLGRNPAQHMAHGMSSKWRTTVSSIPKDLEGEEFERWLWKKEAIADSQYADLRNEATFPPFDELPDENDLSLEFYQSADGFSFRPRKHWCFLAEITDVERFLRLRLIVQDKDHQKIPIAFHTDDRGLEMDPSSLQEGFTVAVLYAEQHGFLDMSIGIRLENPTGIKIFPISLNDLFILSDKMQRYATIEKGMRTCQGCNKKSATLKKCARCDLFWYCDKSCQVTGWKDKGHKGDCKLLKDPDLRKLFLMKWDIYEDHERFGSSLLY
ncbi:hypothetical protein F5Y04DRAFT_265781 [Hypomontagnella monticulosa]|nr:hypothetical protein F5Y04DRAFT_265781 [Hypomontagnella monticulosa]